MPKVKCTYFDLPALGEPIRLLLAYGGQTFTDNTVPMEQWPQVQQTTPYGQLPLYEEDGKLVNQSVAICRYLGKKYKLDGTNDWENLEIDAIADTVRDLVSKIVDFHYEKSAETRKRKQELLNEMLPFYLTRLEAIAKENNGHLAAKKLTWADFYLSGMMCYFSLMTEGDFTDGNPSLAAVRENVFKLPAVTEWYDKHPTSWDGVIQWLKMSGVPSMP